MANDCINSLRVDLRPGESSLVLSSLGKHTREFAGATWFVGRWHRAAARADTGTLAGCIRRFLGTADANYPRFGVRENCFEVRFETRWDPPVRAAAALARRQPDRDIALLYAEPLNGRAGLTRFRNGARADQWATDELAVGDRRLLELGFDFAATYREALDLELDLMRRDPAWTPGLEATLAETRAASVEEITSLRSSSTP